MAASFKRQIHFLEGKNVYISIKISLIYLINSPINNIPVLVAIMIWHRRQDIIWINDGDFTEAYMRHLAPMS